MDTNQMDSKHAPEGDRGHASEDGRILSQLEEAAKKLGSVIGGCSAGRSAKPCNPLVSQILETTEEVASFVTEQTARIAYLENLTLTDELTGLRNRRGFNEFLQRTLASAQRYGDTGVLVFCDLDAFKDINDTFGHHVGDIVLKKVARVIEAQVRETDVVARLGGDEFAILMIQTNWRDGLKRAQMLNHAMNRALVIHDGQEIPVKASFGVEPFGPNDEAGHLVARADMCMYVNKRKKASMALNNAAE